jgi:hypothetical protein
MSLKAEIETWAAALELYDQQNFDDALAAFEVNHPFPSIKSSFPSTKKIEHIGN